MSWPPTYLLLDPVKEWSYDADIFRIFYCTGWDDTVLHYRRVTKGEEPSKVSACARHTRHVYSRDP